MLHPIIAFIKHPTKLLYHIRKNSCIYCKNKVYLINVFEKIKIEALQQLKKSPMKITLETDI